MHESQRRLYLSNKGSHCGHEVLYLALYAQRTEREQAEPKWSAGRGTKSRLPPWPLPAAFCSPWRRQSPSEAGHLLPMAVRGCAAATARARPHPASRPWWDSHAPANVSTNATLFWTPVYNWYHSERKLLQSREKTFEITPVSHKPSQMPVYLAGSWSSLDLLLFGVKGFQFQFVNGSRCY